LALPVLITSQRGAVMVRCRRAIVTGSGYWWYRYRRCIDW